MKNSTCYSVFSTLITYAFLTCNSLVFAQENSPRDAVAFKTNMSVDEEMVLYFASDELGFEEIKAEDLDIRGLKDFESIPYRGGFKAKVMDQNVTISVKNDKRLKFAEIIFGLVTSLDLSCCPELVYLDCQVNQLESLDLSKTSKLRTLVCNRNKLKSLDMKNLSALEVLDCGTNDLSSLELPVGKSLTSLFCMENKLTSLDLTKCEGLTKLSCPLNKIEKIFIRKGAPFESIFFESNAMSAQSTHELIDNLGEGMGNNASLVVINTLDENEKNVCYEDDVKVALGKNYKVYDKYNEENGLGLEYKGSPNAIADITIPSIALYPNPATEYVIVETLPYSRVLLFDAQGALLRQAAAGGTGKVRLDVADIARGSYIVKTVQGCIPVIVK